MNLLTILFVIATLVFTVFWGMATTWILIRRRGTPGSISFALLNGAGTLWLFFSALGLLSDTAANQETARLQRVSCETNC